MKNAGSVLTQQETKQNGTAIRPDHEPSLFKTLRNEVNKVFDDFGFGMANWRPSAWLTQQPGLVFEAKVDVKDKGNEIVITAEVPGVELKDLTLSATPHYISLSGEKKVQKSDNDKGYYNLEREYGFFRRVLHMPCEIDRDHIDADFKNGVLTLVIPKTHAALTEEKRIDIKAG